MFTNISASLLFNPMPMEVCNESTCEGSCCGNTCYNDSLLICCINQKSYEFCSIDSICAENEKCVSHEVYERCYENFYLYFGITVAILPLITTVSLILRCSLVHNHKWGVMNSIFTYLSNASFAFLVFGIACMDSNTWISSFGLAIGIGAPIFLLAFNQIFTCCAKSCDVYYSFASIFSEFTYQQKSYNELANNILLSRRLAPHCQLTKSSKHFHCDFEIEYGSYEDQSQSVDLSTDGGIVYIPKVIVQYDDDMTPILDSIIRENSIFDPKHTSWIATDGKILVTNGNCFLKFMASFPMRIIYWILRFWGIQHLLETIWLIKTTRIEDLIIKCVSNDPKKYRSTAHEEDPKAEDGAIINSTLLTLF